ncbi:STAS domain-containing protein [Streptomyces sp. TX20-6-3]|uniref:STAS domain-containing protein n=1 Tax=Streptomyces sp. TX20-6-3 TaxID=3028705 RepID=UPI0029A69CE6|nr:STAS domain-containing protein [Streptomyces sp. TX20-6-3]MDX2560800.1 STAS domain-containing protein [Streptomyces sp. TX20-6-3]
MHPLPDRSTDRRALTAGSDAQMTVKVTPDGTVVVSGEIDSTTAPHLRRSLRAALRAHPEGVTLDLAAVTFCDCAGLRGFMTAGNTSAAPRSRLDGGRHHPSPLTLGPVSARMTRLLQLTGTNGLFSPPRTGRSQ